MRIVRQAAIVTIIAWSCVTPTSAQMPMFRTPPISHVQTNNHVPHSVLMRPRDSRLTRLPPVTHTTYSQATSSQAVAPEFAPPQLQAPQQPTSRPPLGEHAIANQSGPVFSVPQMSGPEALIPPSAPPQNAWPEMQTMDERMSNIAAWWEHRVGEAQLQVAQSVPVTANELIAQALAQSDHVIAVRHGPMIQQENILKAHADFDPSAFLESRWEDLSNPVGNTLTTGGPTRFNDHHWVTRGGLRQKTSSGGTLELSQEIGLQDTNSLFFLPDQQAQTRMTLGLNQPLLRRA